MALSDPKYFHISDLLSFITGKSLSFEQDLTAPDGSIRLGPKTSLKYIIDLAGHIDGQSYWIDNRTNEYDGARLGLMLPELRASLVAQIPWLKDYPKSSAPTAPESATREERSALFGDWVKSVAANVGGEWFTVHTTTPEPLFADNLVKSKAKSNPPAPQ